MPGTLFNIQRFCTDDGPGIRTTVFFKGCNLHCAWCHNPESQEGRVQMMFFKNKCTGCGKCKEKCPNRLEFCDLCGKCTIYCPNDAREICGKEYSADEVLAEIIKDKAYYENSGGGVTFSGGECMLQIDFLEEMLKKCKENGILTAVDTAPYDATQNCRDRRPRRFKRKGNITQSVILPFGIYMSNLNVAIFRSISGPNSQSSVYLHDQ